MKQKVHLQNKLYPHPNAMEKHSTLALKCMENPSSPYPYSLSYWGQYQKIPSKWQLCITAVLIFNRSVHLVLSHWSNTVLHHSSRTSPELPTSNCDLLLCPDIQDITIKAKPAWKNLHRKPSHTGLIKSYSDELECAQSCHYSGQCYLHLLQRTSSKCFCVSFQL